MSIEKKSNFIRVGPGAGFFPDVGSGFFLSTNGSGSSFFSKADPDPSKTHPDPQPLNILTHRRYIKIRKGVANIEIISHGNRSDS